MRLLQGCVLAVGIALAVPAMPGAFQMDMDRVVPGGGVTVPGWKGAVIDSSSLQQGRTITDSKFAGTPDKVEMTIGPAGLYWNPANTASGDYVVKATFTEASVMSASSHAHPYGIFIGGNKLDNTSELSLLYCAPYANGTVIVRGFSPAPFQMNGRRGEANPAIQKGAKGESVSQEVMWTVKGGRAECSINGTVVAGYDKAELVAPDKLDSLDGIAGVRVSHNVDVVMTGFSITK